MKFEQDDQSRNWTEEDPGQWTKEQAKRDQRFDFAAFLGPDSLEDKVTDVLDGKDLLDEQANAEFAPGFVPRRAAPSGEQRGRHEAPSPEPSEEDEEPDYGDGLGTQRFDENGAIPSRRPVREPSDFRQESTPRTNGIDPPPRPKVVVAEPAPRVVVTPDRQYSDAPSSDRGGSGGGGSKAMKWLIALLISIGVIALAGVALFTLVPGLGGGTDPLASPTPTSGTLPGGLPQPTWAPVPTAVPTQEVTPPPAIHYTITVTAGTGGSITPSGAVSVEDGDSVTFTITPDEGYEMGQLLIDGSPVSVQSTYTFSNVDQDHYIYAVFQQVQAPPAEETTEPTAEPTAEPPVEPPAEITPEPQAGTEPEPMEPPQGEGT